MNAPYHVVVARGQREMLIKNALIVLLCSMAVLYLWFGYALGYSDGRLDEIEQQARLELYQPVDHGCGCCKDTPEAPQAEIDSAAG